MKKIISFLLFLSILGIGTVSAQTRQVTGTITSAEDGLPVIGASVLVKGTTTGTITDIDGKFSLNIPSTAKTLEVSFVGMKKKEVRITSNSLAVIMETDQQTLDEVLVVAYGTAKKSSFTGSAKAVTAEELTSGSKESLDKALMGKVSGVRVTTNTGDPGSPGDINIRGVGSLSASTSPLYVIDGVPIKTDDDMSYYGKTSSPISSLNPDDIESLTVLKDAAAASLYGSRAANGVIIITTKSGKAGKTKIEYTGEMGWSNMAVGNQYKPMNATDFLEYAREGMSNYYILNNLATNRDEAYKLIEREGDMEALFYDPSGKTNTNWKDEIYRNALLQNHQVSLSGGSEKTQFYAGFGYNKTEGIVIGSDFERLTGRLNLDHKVTDWLSFGFKQSVAFTNQSGARDQGDQSQGLGTSSPLSLAFSGDPTAPVKNPDGTYNENANWGAASNPHLMLGIDEWIRSKTMRSMTNVDATVKFSKQLTLNSIFGYDYTDIKHFEYWSPNSVNGGSVGGLGSRYNYENRTLTSSTTLRYANTWNDVHNFDILGGFEVEEKKLLDVETVAQRYSTDKLPELGNGQPDGAYSASYSTGLLSYLASANYNYNDRYYVSGSFRRDGSSLLGEDNRWANFWSASLAWRLTSEPFFPELPLFTDFKIRASYGTNGTLPSAYYVHMPLYGFSAGYGANSAIYWSQPGNNELGWEKSKNFNVGFDWNMFNRVTLSVEYYNKITTDLLFQVPSSIVTGFSSNWENLGKLKNEGVEVEVSSQNIITDDFQWNTNFNLTYQRALIKELPNGEPISYGDGNMYIHEEGESIYSFYLPEWIGVNTETGLGEYWIDPEDHSKGITNYYDQAGKTIVGNAIPDVMGGMTNTFTYKDFDLSFLIGYQFGGKLFDYPGYFFHHDGYRIGSMNVENDVAGNYWKNPGDKVDYPKPIYQNPYRSDRFSSRHILSTDYIRMREITFGYTVPLLKDVFSKLRIYFRSNNPFMIWADNDRIDPDVPLNGYRQTDTPQTKSFIFGINITL